MATLSNSCDTCYPVTIPHCSLAYTVCGVLTADTEYWSVITDKFGKKHIVNGTTDADGMWTIDPDDYPDGFFSQYGGIKTLQFYTDANLCDIVTITIGDPGTDYTCISIKVVEHSETYDTWDVMCLCEEVVVPASPLYLYALGILVGNATIDTYNSVTVDGTTYSSQSGSQMEEDDALTTTEFASQTFLADMTTAGLVDGAGNDVKFWGSYDNTGFLDQFFFLVATEQAHTITVNLTVNGVTADYPLSGGLFTYVPHECVITTGDPASETLSKLLISAISSSPSTSIGPLYCVTNPAPVNDPVQVEAEFNTWMNTTSNILDYNIGYTDNGDGTITITNQIPHVDCDPPNGTYAVDLRLIETSVAGIVNNNPA